MIIHIFYFNKKNWSCIGFVSTMVSLVLKFVFILGMLLSYCDLEYFSLKAPNGLFVLWCNCSLLNLHLLIIYFIVNIAYF